jgi:hypothetical protein
MVRFIPDSSVMLGWARVNLGTHPSRPRVALHPGAGLARPGCKRESRSESRYGVSVHVPVSSSEIEDGELIAAGLVTVMSNVNEGVAAASYAVTQL